MTLIKSLLLGSAAGIVAVASAQAADLPTKKGAPAAEYVRICTITANGTPVTGFVLPGSDTCFKISGYITAQYTLGSLSGFDTAGPVPSTLTHTSSAGISNYGMFERGQVNFEAVSNTAYGPLYSIIELQGNNGSGFDSVAGSTVINHAYLTWAGLTAGKHGSFFDYLAGGYTWDDLISPDHSGTPVPLIAYTASFGGGFSATVSAEQNTQVLYGNAFFQGGLVGNGFASVAGATRDPDLVASLDLTQGWGNAHLAGVAHNVREVGNAGDTIDKWGFAVIGGLTFNLPSFGAGDDIRLQGVYSKNAIGYSGLTSIGAYNASGIAYSLGDAIDLGGGVWSSPTTWSVAIRTDFALGPTFSIHPEISYGHLSWSNLPAGNALISPNLSEFVGGGAIEWVPVKNLVFDLDLLYLNGTQSAPSGWTGVGVNAWHSGFSGFNGKLRIERDF